MARKLARARESKLAKEIRKKIGAGPDDEVLVETPQFTREAGVPPPGAPPRSPMAWALLRKQGENVLRYYGLRPWGRQFERPDDPSGEGHGPLLMLFPGEWYPHIPEGFEIVRIDFRRGTFERGKTSNDIRFGCLAFGVIAYEPN